MWLLFANPLVRRIAIYGAIVAGALLFYRWRVNRAWEEGHKDGVISGMAAMEAQKKLEWEKREADLVSRRTELDLESKGIATDRELLSRTRIQVKTDFEQGLNRLRGDLQNRSAEIARVEASQLIPAIKLKLEELRQ